MDRVDPSIAIDKVITHSSFNRFSLIAIICKRVENCQILGRKPWLVSARGLWDLLADECKQRLIGEVKGDSHQIWGIRSGEPSAGPGAATELDQPHRDREGMCAITMPCVCSPTVATLTPCHKIGCKIVHSVQDFHN